MHKINHTCISMECTIQCPLAEKKIKQLQNTTFWLHTSMAHKWTGVINYLKIITSKPNNTIKSCDYAHKVPCNLKCIVNNTSRGFS